MSLSGYIISGAILMIAILIAVVAQIKVSSTYSKYSKIDCDCGITGRELAEKIINSANLKVSVRPTRGNLTDNFNPVNHTINISQGNYESSSIAALGVVAHECGHALQEAKGYFPYKVRQFVVKASNIVSSLLMPLLIIGLIFDFMYIGGITGMVFIWAGVGIYGVSVLANLATLPVELDASRRAMKMLGGFEIMDKEELFGARKVLSAAALTYLASLLVSVAYLFRFLLIALSATRDR